MKNGEDWVKRSQRSLPTRMPLALSGVSATARRDKSLPRRQPTRRSAHPQPWADQQSPLQVHGSHDFPCKTEPAGLYRRMTRVFVSEGSGAAVHIFANDHCPPHVHARHPAEGWIVRIGFSFIDSDAELLSIAPSTRAPRRPALNRVLGNVQAKLPTCREIWWNTQLTTCLANQWVAALAPGNLRMVASHTAHARQIADAQYQPTTQRLRIRFRDGATTELGPQP